MSTCLRPELLEAVATGEASLATSEEVHTHAKHCARCHHELNWLESETQLFRARASRDEVAALWAGVERRSGMGGRGRGVRALWAVAASVLLVLGVGRLAVGGRSSPQPLSSSATMSEPLMSLGLSPDLDTCSRLPDGVGFHCGPAVPASFLASR